MDLAEIRKKARLQNAPQEANLQERHLPQPAPVQSESTYSDQDLNNFWDSEAGLIVSTEEEFVQSLQNYDVDPERDAVQWLTFFLNDEEYALRLSDVIELVRPRHLTELPQVPDYLLGIVSLRGVIVPVIDLGQRLHLPSCNDESQRRIVVCANGEQRIGFLVDKIAQVVKFNSEQVEPPPLLLNGQTDDFVSGVGRDQGRMMMLLDTDKIMDIEPLKPEAIRL